MRRLVLTLLCALVAVPTAVAATRATGDGVFELNDVYGNVTIGWVPAQAARGALWGQMAHGTVRATDPTGPGDGVVLVSGYEHRWVTPATSTTPRVITYSGDGIHFRVTGGKYRLSFTGSDINLTAVGVGVATLLGDPKADDPGQWSKDSGVWQPLPLPSDPTAPLTVSFGVQPTTTGP